MHVRILGFLFLVILPLAANAATAAELQAQIAELLGKITALQSQLGTPTAGQPASPPQGVAAQGMAQCPHTSRVLRRGATGADVSRLQQFLALDPATYPEAQVTGYYGTLTEKAVQRFQCKNRLVCDGTPDSTGYGVAGPRTAALMALQCPDVLQTGASHVGGFIKVTPITGGAPLPVTIEATVNTTKSCSAATYEVDYGDNAPKTLIVVPANTCGEMRQILSHTYSVPGTFTVTLRSGVQQTYATVIVGGIAIPPPGVADSMSATPLSGAVPFTVTFRGTVNAAGKCTANSYTLDFGNGHTAPVPSSGCVPSSFTVTHVYAQAGNFTARLVRDADSTQVGSASIVASGSSSGGGNPSYGSFFSVSPGHGGDIFTVLAEFEIPSACTGYQLNWGDSSAQSTQSHGSCSSGTVSKQFEHTYANPGSYTVVLKRGANLSETHAAGITISN